MLQNRFRRQGKSLPGPATAMSQVEELLIEKLDYFVSSIESKLDHFDSYFKVKKEESKKQAKQAKQASKDNSNKYLSVRDINSVNGSNNGSSTSSSSTSASNSRRNSTSSIASLKEISIMKLNLVQDRLRLIRKSVLSKGFTNLDYLYNLLDDQYNYLFNQTLPEIDNQLEQESEKGDKESVALNKEILSGKIINTISYFEEKLIKIDDYIREKTPLLEDEMDTSDAMYNKLRFFNFNRALKNALENPRGLIHYYELPLSWRENKYIIEGYRFSLKHTSMLKSIFKMHNETMNIWTHLVGLGIILYIAFVHFPSTNAFSKNNMWDNLAMYQFLAAACTCLISSSIWHTYSCFAHYPSRQNFACIDYTGITILITCSIIAVEYCTLFQHPNLLYLYMAFSIAMGVFGFVFNWSLYFDKPECRSLRIGFFVGLSTSGATALLCQAYYEGILYSIKFFLPLCYKSFVWYGLGVVFYGGLIPERWRYDVIIEENIGACQHHYNIEDVLEDNVGHAGREEIQQIEKELEEMRPHSHAQHGAVVEKMENKKQEEEEEEEVDNKVEGDEERNNGESVVDDDELRFRQLINKHFKKQPVRTPYANSWLSLWWVDYFLASHNLWHICVVLGVLGHYSSVLNMLDGLN